MRRISCLAGSIDGLSGPLPVFHDDVISFLDALSKALLHDSRVRHLPDVATFAFWCRKSNLLRVKETHSSPVCRVGRGLALHIAPSNVPVNFAFSYAFSLLAGNPSIVRVPSKGFQQVAIICEAISALLPQHPTVANITALVEYPSESDITAKISAKAMVRVIWGGDDTVASIKALQAPPRCVDITFPDRYSLCLMDDNAVAELDESGLSKLAQSFYNDTYGMDQNACSSPHVIMWTGDNESARDAFWSALSKLATERYALPAVIAMDKFDQSCRDAFSLEGLRVRRYGNQLFRCTLSSLPYERLHSCDLRGVAGYFYECDLNSLDDLKDFVTEKYQTLTYFGITPTKIADALIGGGVLGADRIVPVGDSLDIGTIWDGYDLIAAMSRCVDVR